MANERRGCGAGLRAAALATALVALAGAGLSGCVLDPQTRREVTRDAAFDTFMAGERLLEVGNYPRAKEKYLEAAAISPRPLFFYKAGHCNWKLGQPDQAIAYYERALAEAPDFELASAEMELVRLQLREQELRGRTAPAEPRMGSVARGLALEKVGKGGGDGDVADKPVPATIDAIPEAEPTIVAMADPAAPTPAPATTAGSTARSQGSAPAPVQGEPPQVVGGVTTGLGAFSDAVEILRGGNEKEGLSGELDKLDREKVRRTVFPELYSDDTAATLSDERRSASDSERLGRWDDAARRWARVRESAPNDVPARLAYGRSLARTGRTLQAAEEFNVLVRENPGSANVWFERGNFHALVAEFEAAESDYAEAIRLGDGVPQYRNNLAALHLRRKRYAEAEAVLDVLNTRWADFGPGWLNRALLEDEWRGGSQKALEALETYLRLGGSATPVIERWRVRLRARAGGAAPTTTSGVPVP